MCRTREVGRSSAVRARAPDVPSAERGMPRGGRPVRSACHTAPIGTWTAVARHPVQSTPCRAAGSGTIGTPSDDTSLTITNPQGRRVDTTVRAVTQPQAPQTTCGSALRDVRVTYGLLRAYADRVHGTVVLYRVRDRSPAAPCGRGNLPLVRGCQPQRCRTAAVWTRVALGAAPSGLAVRGSSRRVEGRSAPSPPRDGKHGVPRAAHAPGRRLGRGLACRPRSRQRNASYGRRDNRHTATVLASRARGTRRPGRRRHGASTARRGRAAPRAACDRRGWRATAPPSTGGSAS